MYVSTFLHGTYGQLISSRGLLGHLLGLCLFVVGACLPNHSPCRFLALWQMTTADIVKYSTNVLCHFLSKWIRLLSVSLTRFSIRHSRLYRLAPLYFYRVAWWWYSNSSIPSPLESATICFDIFTVSQLYVHVMKMF